MCRIRVWISKISRIGRINKENTCTKSRFENERNLFLVWERFLEFHRGTAPPPSPSCCSYVCTHPLFRDFRRKGHPLIGLMDSPKVTTVWIASSSSSTSSFVFLSLSMKWIFSTIDWERIAVNLSNWENLISRCCIELKFVRVRRKKIKMRRTEGGAERERGNKEICQRAIHSRKVTALEGKCSKDTGMDYLIVPSSRKLYFVYSNSGET